MQFNLEKKKIVLKLEGKQTGETEEKYWCYFVCILLLDYSLDGQFAWVDGASVSYNNWNPGMPVDTLNQPDCGTIYLGKLFLNYTLFLFEFYFITHPTAQLVLIT